MHQYWKRLWMNRRLFEFSSHANYWMSQFKLKSKPKNLKKKRNWRKIAWPGEPCASPGKGDDTVYFPPPSLSLFDTLTPGEGYVPVCLVTSQTSWFGSLPSNTLWCFTLKSCPSIINILPFMFPAWEGERKERNQSSLKHKLTALRRLTLHQRGDVPDTHLNFHNKVMPRL